MKPTRVSLNKFILNGFLMLLPVTLLSGCNDQEIATQWTERPIVVDGKIDDWEGKATTYHEDQQAVIGFCSDSTHLYIQFRTKDVKWASLINRAGLAICVDTEGGKDKNFYIKFFDGPELGGIDPGGDGSERQIPPGMDGPFGRMTQDRGRRLLCFARDRIAEMPIDPEGSQGPTAAYDTSWGFYCYEFAIPLQESVVRYYGMNSGAGQKISIGAIWADIDTGEMRGKMGGGRGGGGGMPPGGGMPGGGMGGQRPNMPQKQEIWIKTTLAVPTAEEQTAQTEA